MAYCRWFIVVRCKVIHEKLLGLEAKAEVMAAALRSAEEENAATRDAVVPLCP